MCNSNAACSSSLCEGTCAPSWCDCVASGPGGDCVIGTWILALDCYPPTAVIVDGTWNITGVPDSNGELPVISGGGSGPVTSRNCTEVVLYEDSLAAVTEMEERCNISCAQSSCVDGHAVIKFIPGSVATLTKIAIAGGFHPYGAYHVSGMVWCGVCVCDSVLVMCHWQPSATHQHIEQLAYFTPPPSTVAAGVQISGSVGALAQVMFIQSEIRNNVAVCAFAFGTLQLRQPCSAVCVCWPLCLLANSRRLSMDVGAMIAL